MSSKLAPGFPALELPETREYLREHRRDPEVTKRRLVWGGGGEHAPEAPACRCGAEQDRRCLQCGIRLCEACAPAGRCPRCGGKVYRDGEELPQGGTNPALRGY
jgi:hypothetical protein